MAAFQFMHLQVKFTSLSPVLDNPSFHLHYQTTFTTATIEDVNDLCVAVSNAVNSINTPGTTSLASNLSMTLSTASNMSMIDAYDVTGHLTGTPAGSPVLITSFTKGATISGSPEPEGVAVVATLQAPYGADVEFGPGTRPRARDRGRIYFGPWSGNSFAAEATTNRCIVPVGIANCLLGFLKKICVVTTATSSVVYNLSVWSKKNGAMKSLQEAWVDDRPDYQRRRTDQGSSRFIIALP